MLDIFHHVYWVFLRMWAVPCLHHWYFNSLQWAVSCLYLLCLILHYPCFIKILDVAVVEYYCYLGSLLKWLDWYHKHIGSHQHHNCRFHHHHRTGYNLNHHCRWLGQVYHVVYELFTCHIAIWEWVLFIPCCSESDINNFVGYWDFGPEITINVYTGI